MAPTLSPPDLRQQSAAEILGGAMRELSIDDIGTTGEHIFRSKLPDIEMPVNMTLPDYCLQNSADILDRVAVIDGVTGDKWTYGEMQILFRRVAAGLDKLGIGKGDVIALLLPNCVEFVALYMGSATRGSIVTPANPFCTEREIGKQLRASKAKLVVTQAAFVDKVVDLGLIVITTDSPPEGTLSISILFENDENDAPAVEIDWDEVVCLPYSSGTTGLPKGVMLTHKSSVCNLVQQLDGENPGLGYTREDVIVCLLPLFHIYASSVMCCSLRSGCTLVIMPKYTIPQLLELIQKYRVTVLPIAPPVVVGISKSPIVENYDLSSVRIIITGAAPLGDHEALAEAFHQKFPNGQLGQGYGMTEAGALSMCLAFAKDPFPVKSGACGTVVRNAEMKIVDLKTGLSLPYNKAGELCIRGPQIMKGYLNNAEATAETIDKGGWLHTGDIAYVDEDEEIFIVDRLKEIIKFKGFQVPPAELEAILVTHQSIVDAAVVPKKDETGGEVPVAFVVVKKGSTISEDEVKNFISKQVVYYKRLHSVYFVDAVPKSPAGKILRKDLRIRL